jgi:hypothetical protein
MPRMSEPLRIPIVDQVIRYITAMTPITTEQIHGWAIEGGKRLLHALASFGGSLFAGALGAVLGLFLMLFLLFFSCGMAKPCWIESCSSSRWRKGARHTWSSIYRL